MSVVCPSRENPPCSAKALCFTPVSARDSLLTLSLARRFEKHSCTDGLVRFVVACLLNWDALRLGLCKSDSSRMRVVLKHITSHHITMIMAKSRTPRFHHQTRTTAL